MRAVDTNVMVRLLVADDGAETARAEAFVVAGRPVWVSVVVLVETVWLLRAVYGWKKAQLLALLDTATASKGFGLQAIGAVRAALELYRASKEDFPDCLALELARAEGHVPFATFDKDTGNLPRRRDSVAGATESQGDGGDIGIIRSPLRAIVLPDRP